MFTLIEYFNQLDSYSSVFLSPFLSFFFDLAACLPVPSPVSI